MNVKPLEVFSEKVQQPFLDFIHRQKTPPLAVVDTLSVAPQKEIVYVPSKPALTHPNLVELEILGMLDRLHAAGTGLMDVQMKSLDECHEDLQKIQAEMAHKVTEAAKKAQSHEMWSLLQRMGAFALAATSCVLGTTVLPVNTLVGAALIASGIATIANLAFADAGVWDWVAEKLAKDNEEKQKQIATLLPCAIGILAAGAGVIGTGGSTAILSQLLNGDKILLIIQTAINLVEGVISIGNGASEFRRLNTQADLTSIKSELFQKENAITRITGGLEKFVRRQSQVVDEAKKIIGMAIHANNKIILQG